MHNMNYQANDLQDLVRGIINHNVIKDIKIPSEIHYVSDFSLSYKKVEVGAILDILVGELKGKYQTVRIYDSRLIVVGDGFYLTLTQTNSFNISTLYGNVYSSEKYHAEMLENEIERCIDLEDAGDAYSFRLNWYYMTHGNMDYSVIDDISDDILLDSAYPYFKAGVDQFIEDYLNSPEPVLILRGPPGTGKTRLIRKILGQMTKRKGSSSKSIYTGDEKVFNNEKLFINFIVDDIDAFVVEDADYLLECRSDGNKIMHNFLKGADGLVTAKGKKMIFSVNIANNMHIDEALTRPGRCFGVYNIGNLKQEQAEQVLADLAKQKGVDLPSSLLPQENHYSLAQLYKLAGKEQA